METSGSPVSCAHGRREYPGQRRSIPMLPVENIRMHCNVSGAFLMQSELQARSEPKKNNGLATGLEDFEDLASFFGGC